MDDLARVIAEASAAGGGSARRVLSWSRALGPRSVVEVARPWGAGLRLVRSGDGAASCLEDVPEGWQGAEGWGAGLREGRGAVCARGAGSGTWHPGGGRCSRCGGRTRAGSLEGLAAMAHAFARYEEVTPWEALLREVSRSAGAVEWLQAKLGEAREDGDLLPDGEMGQWVKMWNEQRKHALAVYKATMDIGVERILAEQNRIDGERMATALGGALDALDLSPQQREAALGALRRTLEAQSAQDRVRRAIEGPEPGGAL